MPNDEDTTADDNAPNGEGALPSILGGMSPDELFARGMQSVRMTGGGSLQSWEPPTVKEAERLFPNYQITEMIGRGGMGVVYKGKQTSLDRIVAIKLLPLEVSIDRDFGDRFVREARTMAKMNHPNIVSVFDFGHTTEGHLYFVMEFVEGTTLHHLIKAVGLKPVQSLELIVGVCEALQYAHSEGVIHRDIKPANILVDTKGRVKVTDFGLARMDTAKTPEQWGQTMTGMVLGTPDYMAPEQKKGIRVDHRADIYSLGVMLYEMLCGEIPAGIFDPPSLRVAVDERIDQVVIRAMQQEPDRRYASSGEMKTAVENIRNTPLPQKPASTAAMVLPAPPSGPGMIAPPPGTVQNPAQSGYAPAAKPQVPVGTLIAVGCAVIAVSVVLWKEFRPPAPDVTKSQKSSFAQEVPAPEGPKTDPPKAAPAAPDNEQFGPPATPELLLAAATPAVPMEKAHEPVAPVTPPPADAPVAVAAVKTPATVSPRTTQLGPTQTTITGGPRITPVTPMASGSQIAPPTSAQPETETPLVPNDWRTFVSNGDNMMRRRHTDEAIDAYAEAIEVAQANPKGVSPTEFGRVCMSLGALQIQNGSPAEARRTLIEGRQFLLKTKGPVGTIGQIEEILKKLPRD